MLDYALTDHVAGRGINDDVAMLSRDQTEALFLGNLFEGGAGYTTSAEPPDDGQYAALMHTLREKLAMNEAIVGNRDFSRFALHLIQTVGHRFPIFEQHISERYARVFLEAELGEALTDECVYRWLGTLYVERRQPHMPARPTPETLQRMAQSLMDRTGQGNLIDAYIAERAPRSSAEWDVRARGIAGDMPGLWANVHTVMAVQAVCDGVQTSAQRAMQALHTAVHEAMQLVGQVRVEIDALSQHATDEETSMWRERASSLTQHIRATVTTILEHGKAMLTPIPSLLREGRIELGQLRTAMRSAIERISAYDTIIRHTHTFFEQHGALKVLRTEVQRATQRAALTSQMTMADAQKPAGSRPSTKARSKKPAGGDDSSKWMKWLSEWGSTKRVDTPALKARACSSASSSQKIRQPVRRPRTTSRDQRQPSTLQRWGRQLSQWWAALD